MTIRGFSFGTVAALVLSVSAQVPAFAATAPDKCAALAGKTILGNVKINAATRVAAAAPGSARTGGGAVIASGIPAHCKVEGVINERAGFQGKPYGIGFALALPDTWSGRFLLMGGGGLNGNVGNPIGAAGGGDTPALARGFAVIAHDSGHKGTISDREFFADQRAALDFAESSVRVVAETAKAMIADYYGKPIDYSYMAGCSTGGRESMLALQRYPELFDGIIVGAPAMRSGYSGLALTWAAVQFNQAAPRDADGKPIVEQIFSAADRKTFLDGLLAQCDGLDGLNDGLVSNVMACKFDPAKLQCKGAKSDTCLSAAQVKALQTAYEPPKDKAGRPLYVRFPYDTNNSADPGGFIPTGKPGMFVPSTQDLSLDVDARLESLLANGPQRLIDTNVWTNLNTFTGHGGKVIFWHGVSDMLFSAFDTLDYWQRAEKANPTTWADSSRFYFLPGVAHCSGGLNAFDNVDFMTPLMAWVEKGQAPAPALSKRSRPTPAERPLCAYPSYAHYTGGDESKASSFACRAPAG